MIQDKAFEPDAGIPLKPITISVPTAVSLAGVIVATVMPGFRFEITRVEDFARGVTAAITYDVTINAVTALAAAATPVAATRTEQTLATARSARRGDSNDTISVVLTTNGSGAATNLQVTIWVRPYPLNGETVTAV